MPKERDKHLDDLYRTDILRFPGDYGEARCICGGQLDWLLICSDCHIQYNKDDLIFFREGNPL